MKTYIVSFSGAADIQAENEEQALEKFMLLDKSSVLDSIEADGVEESR